MTNSYVNPYANSNFFEFIQEFFIRFIQLITGQLPLQNLASDEIQLFVLFFIAASSALVGTFLVLRKMTMLANSISHTILLGIVLAFVFANNTVLESDHHYQPININVMLLTSLVVGVLTAFLTEFLTKSIRLQEDASTGIVFTTLFALGIILATLLTRNAHIGTEVVMGNIDSLHIDDIRLVFLIFVLNLLVIILFFKEYKITTFDAGFASALGISANFFNYLLMVQASSTIIGAFRAAGVLMVLSFITGPVLTARLITHDLKRLIYYSVGFGLLASFLGVAITRHILTVYDTPLSTAGVVVSVIVIQFICTLLYSNFRKLKKKDLLRCDR